MTPLSQVMTAAAFLSASPALGGVEGYYRYPSTNGEVIVFAAEGDLWQVPLAGGRATRLTTHEGEEWFCEFSPDGRWLAFSAELEGNVDVYVMPAAGGDFRPSAVRRALPGTTIDFNSNRASQVDDELLPRRNLLAGPWPDNIFHLQI